MKTKSIKLYEAGNIDNMKWEETDLPDPSSGEVLLRHEFIGFNMIDTYHRSGIYPTPEKPCGLGTEASGIIEDISKDDKDQYFNVGDRVAYAGSGSGLGAYSYKRIIRSKDLIKVPDWMGLDIAAAILTKGRTVEYLFNRTYNLKENEYILFHAAAGGVGQIAGQWARSIGAIAIGVVGNKKKEEYAKKCGYKFVFNMEDHDIVSEIMKITNNKGVDVVYDSVGLTTWNISLSCIKKLGLIVSFGSASGNPPLYDIAKDGIKNSAFIHRATMVNYMTSSKIARDSAARVFEKIKNKEIQLNLNKNYQLKDVKVVHRDAEARKTIGQIVMKV
ncbi:MAG: quinone oxidoreductase [Rhodobiaceae bacterium]|nr:quinone oxidoreductase [Rhodobiaceae bacterium]